MLSGKPRLVVRPSLRHMTVQLVKTKPKGDQVLAAANSIELIKKYGWLSDCGNLPAAYLTGLLAGQRALSKGFKEAVLDTDLRTPSKGSRLFTALKGAIDAGLKIQHNKEILPDESRSHGEHIASYGKQLHSASPEIYQKRFAKYLARKLKPETLPEHFEKVKEKILKQTAEKPTSKGGKTVKKSAR